MTEYSCCQKSEFNSLFSNNKIASTKAIQEFSDEMKNWLISYKNYIEEGQKLPNYDFKASEKLYFEKNSIFLPDVFKKLNIIIYSSDWKTCLNPFIIQRLCLIMSFTISPLEIFGEKFIKELIRDYTSHPTYKYKLKVNEELITGLLDEMKEKRSYSKNLSSNKGLLEEIGADFEENVINNPTYEINQNEVFTSDLYNLENNQRVIKHRIHFVYGDNYNLLLSSTPIPHDLAQLLFEYYTRVYDLINDEFLSTHRQKPKNGIYLFYNERTLVELFQETGEVLGNDFIVKQKQLRRKFFDI